MTSILLRAPKSPFVPATVEWTLSKNLIGNNSGNLIFIDAAWKLLATADTEITAAGLAADPARAAEMSERHDAFVLPLANAFRLGWETQLERLAAFIEQLTIPVAVLGVGVQGGVNFAPSHLRRIEPLVKRFVAAVLDHGPSIGVRGETTATYLEGLGFTDVEVIGCPSMFMHGERLEVTRRVPAIDRDSRLAINIGHSMASPYLAQLGDFIDRQVARYPHLTHFGQDRSTLELLVHGAVHPKTLATWPRMPIPDAHPLLRPGRVRFYLEPWPWIDDLADFDFAFGSRIHGNLAAIIAGTPAFVLAHDARTLELARYFEIPHRAMPDLTAGADAADLYAEADYDPLLRGHARRWQVFAGYLERHGLQHSFNEANDAAAFDRRIAEIDFPGPITAPGLRHRAGRGARRLAGGAAVFARRAARGVRRRMRAMYSHARDARRG
jgi:hypothetical protein